MKPRKDDPTRHAKPDGKRPIGQVTTYRIRHTVQWALYRWKDRWLVRTAQVTRGGADLDEIARIISSAPQFLSLEELKLWIEANYDPPEDYVDRRTSEWKDKHGWAARVTKGTKGT